VIILALPLVARAEIVQEDSSLTHDGDNCGYYNAYASWNVHRPGSPIPCFLAINVTVDRPIRMELI